MRGFLQEMRTATHVFYTEPAPLEWAFEDTS